MQKHGCSAFQRAGDGVSVGGVGGEGVAAAKEGVVAGQWEWLAVAEMGGAH